MINTRFGIALVAGLVGILLGGVAGNYQLAQTGQLKDNVWGFKPKIVEPTSEPEKPSYHEQMNKKYVTLHRADGLAVTIMIRCSQSTDANECHQAEMDFGSAVSAMKSAGFQDRMIMRSRNDLVYEVEVHAGRNGSGVTYSVKNFGGVGTLLTLGDSLGNEDKIEKLPVRLKSLHVHYIDASKALAKSGADVTRVTSQP